MGFSEDMIDKGIEAYAESAEARQAGDQPRYDLKRAEGKVRIITGIAANPINGAWHIAKKILGGKKKE